MPQVKVIRAEKKSQTNTIDTTNDPAHYFRMEWTYRKQSRCHKSAEEALFPLELDQKATRSQKKKNAGRTMKKRIADMKCQRATAS